jgi:hypothetical protein
MRKDFARACRLSRASGQNLTLESRRSGGDAIDRTSGFGPEVNCENRP